MDPLSPRARALLDAAHGMDEPLAGDLARVRRGVLVRIGSAGFGATVFSLSLERAQALLGAAAPKLAAVVLMAVTGHAVLQHLQHPAEHRPAPAAHAPSGALSALPRATSVPSLDLTPSLSVPSPSAPPLPAKAPGAAASMRRPARPARAELVVPGPSQSSQLEGEMRWIRAADSALRAGQISAAQGLLDGHAREFQSGALSEEREALRIVAACQGADFAAAGRAAARFLERAPHSLLAGRVRAACLLLARASGG